MENKQPTREELIDALKTARDLIYVYSGHPSTKDVLKQIDGLVAKSDPKPRRWVVEFLDAPQTTMMPTFHDDCSVRIIREVKPITREQIEKAWEAVPGHLSCEPLMNWALRELGIEVED